MDELNTGRLLSWENRQFNFGVWSKYKELTFYQMELSDDSYEVTSEEQLSEEDDEEEKEEEEPEPLFEDEENEYLNLSQNSQQINIMRKKIQYIDICKIGACLAKNTLFPKYLVLSYVDLLPRIYKKLSQCLPMNEKLKWLFLDSCNLRDSGTSCIAEALIQHKRIKALYLASNKIGNRGADDISKLVRKSKTLTHLNLCLNLIGDKGAQSIGEALRVNTKMRYVTLSWNRFGDDGIDPFISLIKYGDYKGGIHKIQNVPEERKEEKDQKDDEDEYSQSAFTDRDDQSTPSLFGSPKKNKSSPRQKGQSLFGSPKEKKKREKTKNEEIKKKVLHSLNLWADTFNETIEDYFQTAIPDSLKFEDNDEINTALRLDADRSLQNSPSVLKYKKLPKKKQLELLRRERRKSMDKNFSMLLEKKAREEDYMKLFELDNKRKKYIDEKRGRDPPKKSYFERVIKKQEEKRLEEKTEEDIKKIAEELKKRTNNLLFLDVSFNNITVKYKKLINEALKSNKKINCQI